MTELKDVKAEVNPSEILLVVDSMTGQDLSLIHIYRQIKCPNEKDVIIEVNEKDISKLYANKKYYFNKFLSNRSGKTYVHINKKVKRGKLKLTIIEKRDEFKI